MSPQLRTPLCDLLGIDVPIMQAGMGNVAYGRMAAAVSNAGGLGSIGGIDIPPEELDAEIKLFRSLGSGPPCVDLGFPANAPRGLADVQFPALPGPLQQLKKELAEHGIEVVRTTDQAISVADNKLKLQIALGHGVEVIACALGTPAWVVEACHAKGATVMSIVGLAKHARMLRNRFTEVWDGHEDELSSFPVQRVLTMPFKYAAARARLKSHMSLAAGAGSGMINDLPGAAEVLERLVEETVEALRTVATVVKFG